MCSRYFFLDKKVPKKSRTYPPSALESELAFGKSETRYAQTVGLSYRTQALIPSYGPAASVMVRKGVRPGLD